MNSNAFGFPLISALADSIAEEEKITDSLLSALAKDQFEKAKELGVKLQQLRKPSIKMPTNAPQRSRRS